jgi:hypothetical protein
MFFAILYQGHTAGAALLVGLATVVAPWRLILPILLWGGRTMEGFGIVASPNLQELTPPIREAPRADWTWRHSAKNILSRSEPDGNHILDTIYSA